MENELVKVQMMEASFSNLTTKKRLKAQLKMKSKIDNALEHLYDRGIFKYQDLLMFLLPKEVLLDLIKQVFIKEIEVKTPKNRRRPVPIPLYGKPMYDTDYIMNILKRDDDYDHLQGPAYTLMGYYDGKLDGNLEDIMSLSSNDSSISLIQPIERIVTINNNNAKRETVLGEMVASVIERLKLNTDDNIKI